MNIVSHYDLEKFEEETGVFGDVEEFMRYYESGFFAQEWHALRCATQKWMASDVQRFSRFSA